MKIFNALIAVLFILGTIASNINDKQYVEKITSRNAPKILINTNITDDPTHFESSRIILNGKRTNVTVGIKNLKNESLVLESFSIHIFDVNFSLPVINLGDIKKSVLIPESNYIKVSFYFSTELPERDYGLTIFARVKNSANFFTYVAYNSTIIVREPEHSFFNIQTIFLYAIIITIILGPYFIFQKWIFSTFQKKKKNRKKILEKKESEKPSNLHYDENWIPEHHLKNRIGTSKKTLS